MNLTHFSTLLKTIQAPLVLLLFSFFYNTNTSYANNGNPSIGSFINADGTLNVPIGFTGSLDISGFSIQLDECEGVVAAPMPMMTGWSALGSGLTNDPGGLNDCNALVVGPNGDLYAGGRFKYAGGVLVNAIARWDGSSWSALGSGLAEMGFFSFPSCEALAFGPDGNLYVGGHFTLAGGISANGIAVWDGSNWSTLGSGINATSASVYAIAFGSGSTVYIGGNFTWAGGITVNGVAEWNGNSWSSLGSGLGGSFGGVCYALAVAPNGSLYVGGSFQAAGGNPANTVARWDGSNWFALGNPNALFGADCRALAIGPDGNLYLGGLFQTIFVDFGVFLDVNGIAIWDGSNWSALGTGLGNINSFQPGACLTLGFAPDGSLYVGGDFTEAGGVPARNIAKWDGNNWSGLGSGLDNNAPFDNFDDCLAVAASPDGSIFAGGFFNLAGGNPAEKVAKWTPPPPVPCMVEITSVDVTDATCGVGSITINANCNICPNILYSVDGGASTQASNTFTGLVPGTYMPYVVSSNDPGCNDMSANETIGVLVPDNSNPIMVCNSFTLSLTGASTTITADQVDGGSTDNCGIAGLDVSPSTFTCANLGAQSVTLTGSDASGNSSSCNATITVVDDAAPTAVCFNATVNLTGSGTTTVDPILFDGGSTAACGGLDYAASIMDFDCSDVGNTISVTLTVTSQDNGETATCNANVSVADPNSFCCAPANAVCNSTSVQLGANGMVSIVPSAVGGGSTAACGLQSESVIPMDFDCNDVGSPVSVMYTIEDINGATSSCNTTVMVEDNMNPTAGCTNVTVQLGANGQGSTTAAAIESGSTDNCGTVNPQSLSVSTFNCSNIGANSVTLTVNDGNGNIGTCTATVTVEDNTPPTPVCKTNTVSIQADGTYSLQDSDVYDDIASDDNCGISSVSFTPTTYDCNDDGQTFTVGVTVTDAGGNTANCNATITVDVGSALPISWSANNIGDGGTIGNAYSFDPCSGAANGEFVISGGGNNSTSFFTDNVAFASQTICGDGTITAKIENVTPNGYGGLMIRETTDAGSKQAAVFSNMTNILRHESRNTTNGFKIVNSFFKPSPFWLRLERSGDWVFAYYSTTGTAFQYVHAVFVPMQSCVEFGLASFTYLPNAQTDATFSNVTVTGTPSTTVDIPGFTEEEILLNLRPSGSNHSLYPNPASSEVNLVFESPIETRTMAVLRNQLGQTIEQRQLQPGDEFSTWNVSLLENGLYFLEINAQGQAVQVMRFVKTE